MSIRILVARWLTALLLAAATEPLLAAEPPSPPAPGKKDDKKLRLDEGQKKPDEEEEQEPEEGPPAPDGEKVVAKKSVRVLDKEEWEAARKKIAPERESHTPEAQVVSSVAKEPTASSLGQRLEVSEGPEYRITRKEILPPLGGEVHESRIGYTALAGGTAYAFDKNGRLTAKRSLVSPQRETIKVSPKREITTDAPPREFTLWCVNPQGWLGIKDSPGEVRWTFDQKGKLIGRSNMDTRFMLWSPTGAITFSTVMESSDVVDIAPDGKTILQWRAAGATVHEPATRKQKRLTYQIVLDARYDNKRNITDSGSILSMLAEPTPDGRTLLHLSPAGEVLHKKTAPWSLVTGAPNGNALMRGQSKPYRCIVLDPRGKPLLEVPRFEYGYGYFLNRGDFVAFDSLPGHREYYGTVFRLSDGQELCSVPSSHFRGGGGRLIADDKLYCYDPDERVLTIYSTTTSRRLRRVLLRHREPHGLKVTSVELSQGALQLTLRGKPDGGGPLVYYKIEVREAAQ